MCGVLGLAEEGECDDCVGRATLHSVDFLDNSHEGTGAVHEMITAPNSDLASTTI
jgi:hypothetical protein